MAWWDSLQKRTVAAVTARARGLKPASEVAKALGVSTSQARDWCNHGCYRLSNHAKPVHEWIAACAEGLTADQAAAYVGVSVRKWHEMNGSGKCPAPVELGDRCLRWPRSELKAWLLAGAPTRVTWRVLREREMRRSA
jgi:predicted DNA-binding transcriptional regulator AlpA